MILNRTYETKNLVTVSFFLPGRAKDLSAPPVSAVVYKDLINAERTTFYSFAQAPSSGPAAKQNMK
jgi:hypothetical protein